MVRIASLVGFKMVLVQKGTAAYLERSYSNLIARQQQTFVAAGSIKKYFANMPRNWPVPQ